MQRTPWIGPSVGRSERRCCQRCCHCGPLVADCVQANMALTRSDGGADGRTRTDNRLFTRQVRYQLRHASRVPANATGGGPGLQDRGLSR